MSCCGQAKSGVGIRIQESGVGHSASPDRSIVIFEYIGRTGLTAVGATGRRYRFDQPGIRITVDARDRASLDVSPLLRQVG